MNRKAKLTFSLLLWGGMIAYALSGCQADEVPEPTQTLIPTIVPTETPIFDRSNLNSDESGGQQNVVEDSYIVNGVQFSPDDLAMAIALLETQSDPQSAPVIDIESTATPVIEQDIFPLLAQDVEQAVFPLLAPMGVRLRIPALGIDYTVTEISLIGGSWDVADLGQQLGWLESTGSYPGDQLAMAISGHVTLADGSPGPFHQLSVAQPGMKVFYEVAGLSYLYEIQLTEVVDPTQTQQVYSRNGNLLKLITCESWNSTANTYTERLIVSAVLVGSE